MKSLTNCIFCKIVAGEKDASRVYEDEQVLAFLDHHPIRLGHTLVISKNHYETILDIPDNELAYLIQITKKIAGKIMKNLNAKGFRISNNNYRAARQLVPHIHFHIIPVTGDTPLSVTFDRLELTFEHLDDIAKKIRGS